MFKYAVMFNDCLLDEKSKHINRLINDQTQTQITMMLYPCLDCDAKNCKNMKQHVFSTNPTLFLFLPKINT